MRKVLITGSSGFIGNHVVDEYLKNNFLVYGIDKKKNKKKQNYFFYKCDILNREKMFAYFKKTKPELVIHLAARTDLLGKKIADYKINYEGTKNVIRICNEVKSIRRVIFASTLLVNKFPYKISNFVFYDPDTIYGKSKVLMEKIIRSKNVKFQWCIIRPTTIWGDLLQNHFKFFLQLIKIKLYFHMGVDKIYKSYGYVKNTSFQIYKLTLTRDFLFDKKTYYLHDYDPICLNEFADKISMIYNKKKIKTIPVIVGSFFSIIGDFFVKLGFINFPLQSRRFRNIKASFILDSKKLKNVCGLLPYNEDQSLHNFLESYKN
jgi:nucleoside-diphosphate-sugar epimerase